EGGLLRVFCTIYVEGESQKPIVIGRAGSMIKRIGTEARQDIARFFNCKVYLDLRVKVKPDWRDDRRGLDALGLPRGRCRASTSQLHNSQLPMNSLSLPRFRGRVDLGFHDSRGEGRALCVRPRAPRDRGCHLRAFESGRRDIADRGMPPSGVVPAFDEIE